jgi:hypothetical protein
MVQHKYPVEYLELFLFLTIAKRIQKNIPTIVAIEKIVPIFYCEGEKMRGSIIFF